ncbi:hypothetical protein BH20BAC1_BH20BAC1_01540 [soil metagenome]
MSAGTIPAVCERAAKVKKHSGKDSYEVPFLPELLMNQCGKARWAEESFCPKKISPCLSKSSVASVV